MKWLLRLLTGVIRGVLFGLAVGVGFGGVLGILVFLIEDPLDRLEAVKQVSAIVVGSTILIGLCAGIASSAFERGLSFFESAIIVVIAGTVAVPLASPIKSGSFLLAPLIGTLVGGILAVLIGAIVSSCGRDVN